MRRLGATTIRIWPRARSNSTTPHGGTGPKHTCDAIVIGSGIVGSSTAYALAKQGLAVTVVDCKSGPGEGTTSYSSGCLRVFYSVPSAAHLAWESYHFFSNWKDLLRLDSTSHSGMKMRVIGGIVLDTPAAASFLGSVRSTMERLRIPVVEMSKEAARERCALMGWDISKQYVPQRLEDPDFGKPLPDSEPRGACYFPTTAYVSDPRAATQDMALAAQKLGAKFLFGQEVTEILICGGGDVVRGVRFSPRSPVAEIESPIVVNCAGPHSSEVNKLAFASDSSVLDDMNIKTRALRSEVAIVDAPPGINYDEHGVMSGDLDLGIYSRPEFGNRILVGGTEPTCDPLEWVDGQDPEKIDRNLGDQWDHHVHRCAIRIPALQIPLASKRRGVVSTYDCTPDWSPIIDRSKLQGYYMNIGTSGNCFKSAPVMGDMLAQLIRYCADGGGDHDGAAPYQYPCVITGGTIDMRSFSRLRRVHEGSSNVLG